MKIIHSYILIIYGLTSYGTVMANDVGYDSSRKVVANKVKDSDAKVGEEYKTLLNLIKRSHTPGDDAHIAETAQILADDQSRWLSYRSTHCQLQANIYVFPSTSRMWGSEYNSCKLKMNNKRIKFFNKIRFEYNQ